jgi:hypothetical protein
LRPAAQRRRDRDRAYHAEAEPPSDEVRPTKEGLV